LNERRLALIVALIGLIGISHAVIFIRLAGEAPALFLAVMRVGVATLVFAPFAWRAWGTGITGRQFLLSIAAGLFLALHFGVWIESVQRLTIAESALLVSLAPIWVIFFEFMLFGRRPGRAHLVSALLCLLGLAIIGWDGLQNPAGDPVGLLLALVGGIAAAGYFMAGKTVREDVPTSLYVTICYGAAALALGIGFAGTGPSLDAITQTALLAAVALGLASQVVGHTSYNFALGKLSPVFVAICLLGEPVMGTLLGLVYLGEAIPQATIIGGVPIMMGLWIAVRAEMRG